MSFLDFKSRKGQVTLFIILGLVVVTAFIGVVAFKDYFLKSEFERESEKVKVVDDFAPIYDSYKKCVSDITKEGIGILASQGGYIDIPKYEYIPNPLSPFSNKLDVFNDGNLEVAYWFYESASGIQTEKVPTFNEMQNELSKYINDNIYLCTLNFTGYEDYEINNFKDFDIDVRINDNKIFVEILSDFNVNYKGVNQEFKDLKVVVDSSLGYLYSKAVELYNKEKTENYFEEKTIDYLVIYDQIPYSGESFGCSPRVWNKLNVEGDFKEILETNTDAYGKVDDKYYKIDLGDRNLDTSFIYMKKWPFFMEINGGEEILKEESAFGENSPAASFMNALFCLNNYHFIYDIKYPMMVVLSKNRLDFQFAFEVIIDNNQPKYNSLGFESLETDNRICESKNMPFTFYAIDKESEEYLDSVDIKFSCVGSSCDLGKTSEGNLNTLVPSCVNADIKSYKEGYHFSMLTISTNEEGTGYIYMKPYHHINVDVKVIDNNIREPYNDEQIFINFIDGEDGFSQFLNGDSVNLIEGDYTVRAYIMKKSDTPMKIAGDEVEYCSDIPKSGVLGVLGFKDKKCFNTKLEDVELDQVLVGCNEFEWSYNGTGSEMIFYINFDKVPNTVNEMGDIYSKIYDKENVKYPEVI